MQGIISGATNYSIQSKGDIENDLNNWLVYAKEQLESNESNMNKLIEIGCFNSIPFGFKGLILDVNKYINTVIGDINEIIREFYRITKKHCELLNTIGNNAKYLNKELGKVWYSEIYYDNSDEYKLLEKIYCSSRDFCATLIDALNMGERLKDYVYGNGTNELMADININNSNNVNIAIGNGRAKQENKSCNDSIKDIIDEIKKFNDENEYKNKEIVVSELLSIEKLKNSNGIVNDKNLLKNILMVIKGILFAIPSNVAATMIANKIVEIIK